MDINALISLAQDVLTQGDWAVYNNWGTIDQVVTPLIPDALLNYHP
ncbi:MAG: hypothetical protein ACTIL2_01995 [Corynebacterium sp.]